MPYGRYWQSGDRHCCYSCASKPLSQYLPAIIENILKDSGVSCYWDGMFIGAFGFALQLMLNMCESFASSCGLQFNASKHSSFVLAHHLLICVKLELSFAVNS